MQFTSHWLVAKANKIDVTVFATRISNEIYTLSNVLSVDECQNYISYAESEGFEEATVNMPAGQKMAKNIRNNDRVMIIRKDIAKHLWLKVERCFPKVFESNSPIGLNEMIKFYRYDKGQRFKRHKDGRYKANSAIESRLSFLIYLNDDYEGGETKFQNIKIKPKQGMALCFVHELWHEGLPIIKGRKYMLRSDVMYGLL